jgi:hypothetical protein
MRRILAICAALPLIAGSPQELAQQTQQKTPEREVLDYAVEWRLVNAGRATLSWSPAPASEKAAYEIKLHVETTGLVSRLFRVNDDYTSVMNKNMCAQMTFLNAHEAGRNRETKVVFDEEKHKASYNEKDLTKNTVVAKEIEIPGCVHDIVGGLYHLRTVNLEPGKSIVVPVSDGKKSVMMKVQCERREELKTPLGPRKTIMYEAFAFNDVLYHRSGRLYIWLTDDARHVPVQIQVRLQFTIGTITLKLDKEEKS